jgi:hypothetical protein
MSIPTRLIALAAALLPALACAQPPLDGRWQVSFSTRDGRDRTVSGAWVAADTVEGTLENGKPVRLVRP